MLHDMMATKGSSCEEKLESEEEWSLGGRPLGGRGGEDRESHMVSDKCDGKDPKLFFLRLPLRHLNVVCCPWPSPGHRAPIPEAQQALFKRMPPICSGSLWLNTAAKGCNSHALEAPE